MEWWNSIPDWLAWCAAGGAGAAALTFVAGILEAVFELETG